MHNSQPGPKTRFQVAKSSEVQQLRKQVAELEQRIRNLQAKIATPGGAGSLWQPPVESEGMSDAADEVTLMRVDEERLRIALTGMFAGLWDWNIPTKEVFFSAKFKELLGFTDTEFPDQFSAWEERLHPDDHHSTLHAVNEHLEHRARYDLEYRLRVKSGEYRWFNAQGQAIWDASGKPVRMVGSLTDVHDRRCMEESLIEWRNRYEAAINASGQILYDWSAEKNENTYAGDTGRILGYPVAELNGPLERWIQYIHPEDAADFVRECERTLSESVPFKFEYRMRRSDGNYIFVEDVGHFCHGADGRLRSVIGFVTDVTDRKRSHEALRNSEERYRVLIREMPSAVIVHGTDTKVLFWNTMARELLGMSDEDLLDLSTEDQRWRFFAEDETPLDPWLHPVKRVIHTGKPVTDSVIGIRNSQKGTQVWALANANPVFDPAGNLEKVIVSFVDISERRQLEEELRHSQKMDAIGRLSAGVAHDFNNILTIIRGNASLLRIGKKRPGMQQHNYAAEIENAAERASKLTQQLLLFSRRQKLQPINLDLKEVISNTARMLQRIVGEDIELRLPRDADPIVVHADSGMMEQVLLNLVVNARDAMPYGGVIEVETSRVKIEDPAADRISGGRPGKFACLAVRDTGCGIPPEIASRIFEPFFTTKEVGKGTGLGLATIYGIAQRHGGWVDFESKVDHGTIFRMYLPEIEELPDLRTPADLVGSLVRGGNGETILLVEDDDALRKMVQSCLVELGYRVLDAGSGPAALDLWAKHAHEIQILLTDLVMPEGINGKELADWLLREEPSLGVVYMSGYNPSIAGCEEAFDETNFLRKPYDLRELSRMLRAKLDADL